MRPSYRRRRRSKFPLIFLLILIAGFAFLGWKFFLTPTASAQITNIVASPNAEAEVRFVDTEIFSSFGNLPSLYESESLRVNSGTVDLEFFDGSVLRLESGTTITLDRVREREKGKSIDISVDITGEKWAVKVPSKTNPLSQFEVKNNGFSFVTRNAEFAKLEGGTLAVFAGSVDIVAGEKTENLAVGQQMNLNESALSLITTRGEWPSKNMIGGTASSEFFADNSDSSESPEDPEIPSSETDIIPENDFGTVEIQNPGKNNERVQTSEENFLITGKVPVGTEKVIVNNYTLQQFVAGGRDFSYRAGIDIGTMKKGENTYEVVALGKNGERASATLTIVFGEKESPPSSETPVISESPPDESETPRIESETTSETIVPETTGLTIDTPANGAVLRDETITVLGKAPANAAKIVVNDFTLTLYRAGSGSWSYKMKDDFGNRKIGEQTITVRAYDTEGKLLGSSSISITIENNAEKPSYWPEERGDYLPPVEGSGEGSTL